MGTTSLLCRVQNRRQNTPGLVFNCPRLIGNPEEEEAARRDVNS